MYKRQIQNADISRGSFYTYFEDKRDLLQYVFSDILMQAHEFCRESLIRNEGNYWKMLDELFLDWFQFKWSENLMELARIVLFQTETEQLIQNAISYLLKDRTSFIIAHRLSTIRQADVILVVKAGKIIEQGTHDELMAMKGYYHDLYTQQFKEEMMEELVI